MAPRDDRMRLRGGVVVHRACATRAPESRTGGDYPGGVSLQGPSKTIIVEPLERPAEAPTPEPPAPPEPQKEPEKAPA